MRTLIFIMFIGIQCIAQTDNIYFDNVNQKIYIQNIINAEGKSEKELTNIVKNFFVNTYKYGTNAIQFADEETGTVVSRGILRHTTIDHHFTLTIQIKEGRLRYTVSDIYYIFTNSRTDFNSEKMIKPNKKVLMKIQQTLEEGLINAINTAIDDDW